jgi:hypothetical protein
MTALSGKEVLQEATLLKQQPGDSERVREMLTSIGLLFEKLNNYCNIRTEMSKRLNCSTEQTELITKQEP